MDILQKIQKIEEEIRETPYHKGTEHHIGLLRARLAKLREELSFKGKGSGGGGFAIKKTGDATLALIGSPSVGKSTLLNKLTNALSPVGDYDFTTVKVIPGMMNYNGCNIQILDLPGVVTGGMSGRGHSQEIISALRAIDLVLIMVDVANFDKIGKIKKELTKAGLRLNCRPPQIIIRKGSSGGIKIVVSAQTTHPSLETIKAIAKEYRFENGQIYIRESVEIEEIIDVFLGNRVYLPALTIVNKIDLRPNFEREASSEEDLIFISAKENIGVAKLKEKIWQRLSLIRIFLCPPGNNPDFNHPLILKKDTTVAEAILKISSELVQAGRKVVINGPSSKFKNQLVSLNHVLADKDIITIRRKSGPAQRESSPQPDA